MQLFVVTSILLIILFHRISSETWNYGDLGPDVWSDTYPSCSGQSQSPINILTACTNYRSWVPFQFSSDYSTLQNFTLTNNGHTIVANYFGSGSAPFTLRGAGLGTTFQFVNFHLHWGENYKSGSEHQVNGVKHAGEIHFVHMQPETGQIAVLAVFIQSDESAGSAGITSNATTAEWAKYFDAADNLRVIGNSTVRSFNLALLLGTNLNDFWRYQGSLTTPPCTEGVIWTVFRTPIVFTEEELISFRTNIYTEDFRSTQPVNGRLVYRSFLNESFTSITDYNLCQDRVIYINNNSAKRLLDGNSFLLVLLFGIIIRFKCN